MSDLIDLPLWAASERAERSAPTDQSADLVMWPAQRNRALVEGLVREFNALPDTADRIERFRSRSLYAVAQLRRSAGFGDEAIRREQFAIEAAMAEVILGSHDRVGPDGHAA